jgi:hypothetical protein
MKAKGHLFPRIAPIVVLGRVDTDTGCGRRECCICSVARQSQALVDQGHRQV